MMHEKYHKVVASRRWDLDDLYKKTCEVSTDIKYHLPMLSKLASECDHVVELGVRNGVSTVALMHGRPARMDSVDVNQCPNVNVLRKLTQDVNWKFHLMSSLNFGPAICDLLFIDTIHTKEQLSKELRRHSESVRKYIVLHDTNSFPELLISVGQLLISGSWEIFHHSSKSNGLTVMERTK